MRRASFSVVFAMFSSVFIAFLSLFYSFSRSNLTFKSIFNENKPVSVPVTFFFLNFLSLNAFQTAFCFTSDSPNLASALQILFCIRSFLPICNRMSSRMRLPLDKTLHQFWVFFEFFSILVKEGFVKNCEGIISDVQPPTIRVFNWNEWGSLGVNGPFQEEAWSPNFCLCPSVKAKQLTPPVILLRCRPNWTLILTAPVNSAISSRKEDKELLEAGFEYVTDRDGTKIYRKRKWGTVNTR